MKVSDRLKKLQRKLDEYSGQRKRLKEQSEEWEEKRKQAYKQFKTKENSLTVVRNTANETLSQLNYELTEPATLALQVVFDTTYIMKMAFTPRRNQTECDVWFEVNGAIRDPFENSGGGVRDVACFGIQAAILALKAKEDNTSPVLIIDEPFSQLKGEEANKSAIEMIKRISEQLGIQILTVSDERADQNAIKAGADKVFRVNHDGEKSLIEEIG